MNQETERAPGQEQSAEELREILQIRRSKLAQLQAEGRDPFREVRYDSKNPGFDMQQYRNIMGEVRRFLEDTSEGRQLTMVLKNCFEKYGYFAFSALNCAVKTEEVEKNGQVQKLAMPVSHPVPMRIEEPFLWLLNQFGIVRTVNEI